MRQSKTQTAFRRCRGAHPLGQVATGAAGGARRRQEDDVGGQGDRPGFERQNDVGRQDFAGAAPEFIGEQRIMIARQDDPGEVGGLAHLLQRVMQHLRRGRFGVEGIARQQNGRRAVAAGLQREAGEGAMARFAEPAAKVFGEIAETLADMQIGTVEETKHGSQFCMCSRTRATASSNRRGDVAANRSMPS